MGGRRRCSEADSPTPPPGLSPGSHLMRSQELCSMVCAPARKARDPQNRALRLCFFLSAQSYSKKKKGGVFVFIELETAILKFFKPQAFCSRDVLAGLWPQSWKRAERVSGFVSRACRSSWCAHSMGSAVSLTLGRRKSLALLGQNLAVPRATAPMAWPGCANQV